MTTKAKVAVLRTSPATALDDYQRFLLEEAKVAVVPGVDFGSDDHVRLSYATSEALISDGLTRMRAALQRLA